MLTILAILLLPVVAVVVLFAVMGLARLRARPYRYEIQDWPLARLYEEMDRLSQANPRDWRVAEIIDVLYSRGELPCDTRS